MKIAIDQNIPGVDETFARHGEVIKFDGRSLKSQQLRDVQALITRSVTLVNPTLLENTAVEFVGTATIGTDHLDIPWLEQQGIYWGSAPGCNADAAAQYTLAMILLASRRLGIDCYTSSVGIVGYGNVGSRIYHLLEACGVARVLACDPPLADGGQAGLSDMDQIAECDVITFHVPLSTSGPYATQGLVDARFLSRLGRGTLLVNTSRGKVIESRVLRNWLLTGCGHAALDVYPTEPEIELDLLDAITVATPHVAGYSADGKLRGTLMVYRQYCEWIATQMECPDLVAKLDRNSLPEGKIGSVGDAILTACPVERDDRALRKIAAVQPENRAAWFDLLRRAYPERRDFAGWNIPTDLPRQHATILETLGFH